MHDIELIKTQLEISRLKARHLRLGDTKQHDRWVKRQGEWKLAALRQTTLHLDVHAPTAPE